MGKLPKNNEKCHSLYEMRVNTYIDITINITHMYEYDIMWPVQKPIFRECFIKNIL